MFTAILSAIAAIPRLLSAIESLLEYFKKAEAEKWFEKSAEVFSEIKPGTTSEEKMKSAKELQDLTKGI